MVVQVYGDINKPFPLPHDSRYSSIAGQGVQRLRLNFGASKLESIEVVVTDTNGATQEVIAALSEKYGAPSVRRHTTSWSAPYAENNELIVWQVGHSRINLTRAAYTVIIAGKSFAPENVAFYLTSILYMSPRAVQSDIEQQNAKRRDL